MKNKGLLIALVGAGAILLLTASTKKKRSYTIDVPPPTKISEQEFRQGASLVQKAIPVAKKVFSLFKKKPKLTAQQQQATKVLSSGRRLFGNEFPDFC